MSNSRRGRRAIQRHQRSSHTPLWLDLHDAPSTPVTESVATLDRPAQRVAVREAGEARTTRPGRMLIQLIAAGWSLNGRYYPAEVLRRDGPGAWPAGTQAFIDHATDEEDEARPAGSVRNLAAVQTTTARWDPQRNALVAEVRLFAPWREQLTDMAEHIGMSIRAWIVGDHGEAEGREGFVVSEIVEGRSVDFVTRPAAGGAIVSVLESAQPQPAAEARNVGAWLESRLHLALTTLGDQMYGDGRLSRDERIALSSAIGDALRAWTARVEADAPQLFERDLFDEPPGPVEGAADEAPHRASEASTDDTRALLQRAITAAYSDDDGRCMSWVMDFDPEAGLVWYSDDEKHWQQGYTVADRQVTLADSRIEVVRRTVYDPVPDPGAEAAPQPPWERTTEEAPEPVPAPRLPVTEVTAELARLDQLIGTTTDPPATDAGDEDGQNADGSPPTAPPNQSESEEPTVSGTQDGARAPNQAGTATGTPPASSNQPAAPAGENRQAQLPQHTDTAGQYRVPAPVASATEAQVAVVVQERDQFRQRANSLAEALTESQNEQRRLAAIAQQAVTEMRRLRANETGRLTVDRLLGDRNSGVPENLLAHLSPRVHAAIHNQAPLTEAGEVDQPALESLVQSSIRTERIHAAQLLEAQGVGQVQGLGAAGDPTMQMSTEQFEQQVSSLFAGIGLDEATTQLATKGR